jgi:hypothetical protein
MIPGAAGNLITIRDPRRTDCPVLSAKRFRGNPLAAHFHSLPCVSSHRPTRACIWRMGRMLQYAISVRQLSPITVHRSRTFRPTGNGEFRWKTCSMPPRAWATLWPLATSKRAPFKPHDSSDAAKAVAFCCSERRPQPSPKEISLWTFVFFKVSRFCCSNVLRAVPLSVARSSAAAACPSSSSPRRTRSRLWKPTIPPGLTPGGAGDGEHRTSVVHGSGVVYAMTAVFFWGRATRTQHRGMPLPFVDFGSASHGRSNMACDQSFDTARR